MKMIKKAIVSLFCSTAVVFAEIPYADEAKTKFLKQKQIDWLRSRGGFVSDKVSLVLPSGEESGYGGYFAIEEIKQGEKIFFVPRDAVIKPYDEAYPYPSFCDTAHRLVDEYQQGEESEFWPYVQYVYESYPHRELPFVWSQAGKDLFFNIVGKNLLEPQEFSFDSCYQDEETGEDLYDYDDETKELLDAAMRILIARGWDHVLVPVYDMANHWNGKYHNIDQLHDSATHHDFEVVALRDIEVGEQLCLSYNQCNDSNCTGIDQSYVAPLLFHDYGFVEQFPQRWTFHPDQEDDPIVIEVAEHETKKGAFQVIWLSGKPSAEELKWLDMNHKRLVGMHDYVLYEAEDLPSHEGKATVEYYNAISNAIQQAILSTDEESDVKPSDETSCDASASSSA